MPLLAAFSETRAGLLYLAGAQLKAKGGEEEEEERKKTDLKGKTETRKMHAQLHASFCKKKRQPQGKPHQKESLPNLLHGASLLKY